MDPEGLQSDLLALRRLYGLLLDEQQYVEDAGSESLDTNARRVLINLLDDAANKVFESHAKMLGTRFRKSYSPWSIQQKPRSLSLANTPTKLTSGVQNTAMVPRQVEVINGEGTFNDPTDQVFFSGQSNSISPGEYNDRLKRCRVCQKPKVKQLTKEISIRDSNGLSLVGNDPNVVGDSAWSSNSQTVDFFKSLTVTNITDEEDKIAREASTKIQQIESCISDLQVASTSVNPFENDWESQLSPTGIFAVGRNDPKSGTTSRTNWNSQRIEELTLQSQPVYKVLPSSQTMSQETGIEIFDQMKNQFDYRWDDETPRSYEELTLQSQPVYKMLPSSQTKSRETEFEMFDQMKNQYDHRWEDETPRSYEELTLQSQPVYKMLPRSQTMSQETRNERFDQNKHQRDHQWYDQSSRPVEELALQGQAVNKMPPNSQRISQVTENETLNQIKIQRDHRWHEETPRSNMELTLQGQQVNTMLPSNQTMNQKAGIEMFNHRKNQQNHMPEETYNQFQSGGVSTNVKKTADKNHHLHRNLSSQINRESLDQMQKTQRLIPSVETAVHGRHNNELQESESIMRKKPGTPDKDKDQINHFKEKQEPVEPNSMVPRESQWLSDSPISSSTHSSSRSSQSENESISENEGENESKSESESQSQSESESQPDSTSLSDSDHEENESEMYSVSSQDQSDKSSSSESSGSISSKSVDSKKQVGRLKKLKDKLAVIFHHHHHHHHHHHDDEQNHKKSLWKRAGKVIGHKTKQVEAYGEKAVLNIQKKAVHNMQTYGEKAVHNIQKKAVPKIQAYGEKAVHNIQKKAVPKIQAYGEKAVHNIQKKAVPKIQAYGEKAVHNIQKKAVHNIQKQALVLQVGHKNQKKHLQKLVGGIIKQSKHLKKPKKSNSKALVTTNPSEKRSGKKVGKKMSWFQMLRTQRKIKRIEKLRGKLNK